jgi:uncharacterized membrane protein YgcG
VVVGLPGGGKEGAVMSAARYWNNLWSLPMLTRRRFSAATLRAIEEVITRTEARHGGEIRFVVETALEFSALWQGLTPRQRALQVFGELGVWDTADNNGVLIYVLMAEHDVEIIADRGIAARVPQVDWEQICHDMETAFSQGQFEQGAIAGIEGVARLLSEHFPESTADRNEQPDRPIVR